jgi:APA family basic amino acid/polyamine antiporter
VPGQDVENPCKTIPRAILTGTLIAAFVYILGSIAIMGTIPNDVLARSHAPYADMASFIFGGSWHIPVAIAAIISCVGALNGWTMIVGRIAYGAAEDGLFPAFFKSQTKSGAPLWGIIVSSCCSIPFIILSISDSLQAQFNLIIEFSVILALVIYLACVASYFVILKRSESLTLRSIFIGSGALLFSVWAIWAASLPMALSSLSILIAGIPLWLWQRQKGFL